jgi:hypothetical protein
MRSRFIVIACVGGQQPAQVSLAEDDGVVQALPANGRSIVRQSRSTTASEVRWVCRG